MKLKYFLMTSAALTTVNVMAFQCPTPGNPTHLSSSEDLRDMSSCTNTANTMFVLDKDITVPGDMKMSTMTADFAGTFDGNNKTIANYQNQHGPMFSKIVDGAVIKDLHFVNSKISEDEMPDNENLGSLAMIQIGNSEISNVSVSNGTIQISEIMNFVRIGGLVGWQKSGIIKKSSYSGTIGYSSSGYGGGLVGDQDTGSVITDSYTAGDIAISSSSGGIIGFSSGQLINSYSVVHVQPGQDPLVGFSNGGICEHTYYDSSSSLTPSFTCPNSGRSTAQMQQQNPIDPDTYLGWDFVNTWKFAGPNTYPILK